MHRISAYSSSAVFVCIWVSWGVCLLLHTEVRVCCATAHSTVVKVAFAWRFEHSMCCTALVTQLVEHSCPESRELWIQIHLECRSPEVLGTMQISTS